MCHFDLPGLRYEPETAEKYKKIDGRPAVLPAVQSKKVEITKVAPPLESSFCWLVDGQKPLIGAKVPYFFPINDHSWPT